MLEGAAAGDVVDEEGTAGAAEVGARDGFVRLLAGGVPEGEFHAFSPVTGIFVGAAVLVSGRGWVSSVVVRWRGGGRWAGADGDDAGAEFNADGDVVVLHETAFAETDCEG